MCSADSFLSQSDPLTDLAHTTLVGRSAFEASAVPGSPRGIAIINLDIAAVRILTAESPGLFVEMLSPL